MSEEFARAPGRPSVRAAPPCTPSNDVILVMYKRGGGSFPPYTWTEYLHGRMSAEAPVEADLTQHHAPTADEQPGDPPAVEISSINLSASAEYASYLAKTAELCWAVANFKAPFYEPTSRAPVDIVAVIDKSGSMRGVKIELVKKTLLFVIDQCKLSSMYVSLTLATGVGVWLVTTN